MSTSQNSKAASIPQQQQDPSPAKATSIPQQQHQDLSASKAASIPQQQQQQQDPSPAKAASPTVALVTQDVSSPIQGAEKVSPPAASPGKREKDLEDTTSSPKRTKVMIDGPCAVALPATAASPVE